MFSRPDYAEHIGDKRLEARVRQRYGANITALESLGFELQSVYSESADNGVIFFMIVLLVQLFKRDALDFSFPKRLTFYQPLMFHREAGCYATVSAFGIMIASYFIDGTVLIASNSQANLNESGITEAPDKNYYYYTTRGTPVQVWQAHQIRLAKIQSDGCTLKEPLNFEDYTRIEYRNLEVSIGIKGKRK